MGTLSPGCHFLRCTVRGCEQPLQFEDNALVCALGHHFDRARAGYVNLLQPQDRRSKRPGDSDESVLARRRLFDSGVLQPVYTEIRSQLEGSGGVLIDVGCGEGSLAGPLAESQSVIGIDLASPAIELAAKRWRAGCWIIANADRGVPVLSDCADRVVSVAARRHPSEFRRILKPGGRAIVAVPAEDDLIELRERIGGTPTLDSRVEAIEGEFVDGWRQVRRWRVATRREISRESLFDILAASYRGQRRSAAPRLHDAGSMEVTISFDVIELEPLK